MMSWPQAPPMLVIAVPSYGERMQVEKDFGFFYQMMLLIRLFNASGDVDET